MLNNVKYYIIYFYNILFLLSINFFLKNKHITFSKKKLNNLFFSIQYKIYNKL